MGLPKGLAYGIHIKDQSSSSQAEVHRGESRFHLECVHWLTNVAPKERTSLLRFTSAGPDGKSGLQLDGRAPENTA